MATVTIIVTLRRTEGRLPVDLTQLAEGVASEIADQMEGTEILADARDTGDELTYEITGARMARTIDPDALVTDDQEQTCARCGGPMLNMRHGQPRRYCSDICRQAAYRGRQAWAGPERP